MRKGPGALAGSSCRSAVVHLRADQAEGLISGRRASVEAGRAGPVRVAIVAPHSAENAGPSYQVRTRANGAADSWEAAELLCEPVTSLSYEGGSALLVTSAVERRLRCRGPGAARPVQVAALGRWVRRWSGPDGSRVRCTLDGRRLTATLGAPD